MEIKLVPVSVESDNDSALLWHWSVETTDGHALSGMEAGIFAAKVYILFACFRFLFTKVTAS